MSNRIDHKAEATKWLNPTLWAKVGAADESVPVLVAVALVHATLAQVAATEALAEQQRIANLIAYHNSIFQEWNGAEWDEKVIDPIREGLGL